MTSTKRISKNIFSLLIGRGSELFVSFISVSLIARYLGVENYGIFTSLTALVFILSKVIDFGFSPIVFRDISRNEKNYEILNTALSIRLVLLFVVFTFYIFASLLLDINRLELFFSSLLFINIILSAKFMNFRELLEVLFKVDLKIYYVMIINLFDVLLLLLLVILMPYISTNLTYLIIVYVLANLPGFLVMLYLLHKKYNYKFRFGFRNYKYLIRESLPLYGSVILTVLFQQVDVLFLRNMDSSFATGIYSAAVRLTMPLGIIPIAIVNTVFPILTRNRDINESQNRLINSMVYKTLFVLAFFAALIVSFKPEPFVRVVFGESYILACTPMVILFWSYLFVFYNNFTMNLLTIYSLQKHNFTFAAITVTLNIIMIILLINNYSYNGTALAKLSAALGGSIFFYIVIRTYKILDTYTNLNMLICCILSFILFYFISFLPFVLYLIIAILIIPVLILKLKILSETEISTILKLLNKEEWIHKLNRI